MINMTQNTLQLIGYACKIAGVDLNNDQGPLVLQQSPYLTALHQEGIPLRWQDILKPESIIGRKDEVVRDICQRLAFLVAQCVRKQQRFSVIGGDHSCAIGTWSGAYDALHSQGDIGLLWIDAHMDSHTPETSESGRIHGMPLAALLGLGYSTLTSILQDAAKLQPANVCLIGVRSFEQGEAELLKRLNVRVYLMEEVAARGMPTVFAEAVQRVSEYTVGYGISLDLDSLDPEEVPGVDVREPGGIHVSDLLTCMASVAADPKLIGTEIVEFDPSCDKNHVTEKLIVSLLKTLAGR
jgi:arginase